MTKNVFTTLKVMLCCWGLLGMTFSAGAVQVNDSVNPPVRVNLPCPPLCGQGSHYYLDTNLTNLSDVTYMWNNNSNQTLPLTGAEIAASAALAEEAVAENYANWVTFATNFIDQNASEFEQPTIDVSLIYASMKDSGYAPSNQAAILDWAENTSLAQRQAFVAAVQQGGMAGFVASQIAVMKKIAGAMFPGETLSHFTHRHGFSDVCAGLEAGASIMGLYAAIIVFIPGGQGAALIVALIAAMFIFMFWAGGCDNGNGNSPPPGGDRKYGK
jgi:hypothetical protein